MHINLLPHSTRLLIQFDKQLRVYLKIWLGVALIVGFYLTYQLFLTHRAQSELAQLELVCEPVRETQQSIERYHRVVTNLRQRHNTLTSLQTPSQPILALGFLVQAVQSQPGRVYVQRLTVQQDQNQSTVHNGAAATPKNSVPSGQNIVIMGQAEDEAALTTLVKDLRQSGWMNRVELKSSSRSNHSSSRQFHIEAWRGLSSQPSPPEIHQVY